MNVATVRTRAGLGIDAFPVTVEVFLSGGLPSFSIVGMAQTALRESKDRVRAAIINAGFDFPQRKITVNLAPADMRKDGGRFDLAIALGILAAGRQVVLPDEPVEVYGELALDGSLRAVRGLLPALVALRAGTAIVPRANVAEAALAEGDVRLADDLMAVVDYCAGRLALDPPGPSVQPAAAALPDLEDVRGQQRGRRALEIAAAGGHNLLMSGPPGTGKTLLAKRLPSLLPALDSSEAIEVASIHSLHGSSAITLQRPFRSPHHGSTPVAMTGGGPSAAPGEMSLAHRGVLFLDELPEFRRAALEVLREPMESGVVALARASYRIEYPARFQLVAAMNPCPCGYAGDPDGRCACSQDRIDAYRARLSGPLLDRIDLHLEIPRQSLAELRRSETGESSATVAGRVLEARRRAMARGCLNAGLDGEWLESRAAVTPAAWGLLEEAGDRLRLSHRAALRMLRVARTIADLSAAETITPPHMAEALSFRPLVAAAL